MFLKTIAKKIGGFFAGLFRQHGKSILLDLAAQAAYVVADLTNSGLPGPEKKSQALQRLKLWSITRGLSITEIELSRLIEEQVTTAANGNVDKILDAGLETAKAVIKSVQAANIEADITVPGSVAYKTVANQLAMRLAAEGKQWATSPETINLLVATALSLMYGKGRL